MPKSRLTAAQRSDYADAIAAGVPVAVIMEFGARLMRAVERDRAYIAQLGLRHRDLPDLDASPRNRNWLRRRSPVVSRPPTYSYLVVQLDVFR